MLRKLHKRFDGKPQYINAKLVVVVQEETGETYVYVRGGHNLRSFQMLETLEEAVGILNGTRVEITKEDAWDRWSKLNPPHGIPLETLKAMFNLVSGATTPALPAIPLALPAIPPALPAI